MMNGYGLVIQSTGSWYIVETETGSLVKCKIKGKFKIAGIRTTNPVAAGDKVHFQYIENDETGLIYKIDERENYIIRKATRLSKEAHIIASNLDQCVIIASIKQPATPTGFIDRLLTTAEAYHIPSVIVFNKIDLYDEDDKKRLNELTKIYENADYKVLHTSVVDNIGINKLKDLLKNKITLFSGNSGVGKSAIINAIEPELHLKTGEISYCHEKGKHTTTFASMHKLTFGGYIIDTPGIKEFGLTGFDRHEVAERFPEIRKYQQNCKFNNCTHTNEPDCAVKRSLAEGKISAERYKNYLSILSDDYFNETNYN